MMGIMVANDELFILFYADDQVVGANNAEDQEGERTL